MDSNYERSLVLNYESGWTLPCAYSARSKYPNSTLILMFGASIIYNRFLYRGGKLEYSLHQTDEISL